MRTAIGIIIGIIVAMASIWVCEAITHTVYPTPRLDLNDPEGLVRIVAAMPAAAKVAVLGGWFVGATLGALTAATIVRRKWAGWVPVGLVLLAGVANLALIPHPWWMNVGAVALPVLGGWLGIRLAKRMGEDAAVRLV